MKIFVYHNGQQNGPYTEAEVRSLLASGVAQLSDLVWWEGQSQWVPLRNSPFAATLVGGLPQVPSVPPVPSYYPTARPVFADEEPGLAIASLVCACLSVLCCCISAIPAIILGHLALAQNRGGKGMAIAGLIIGYLMLLIYLIWGCYSMIHDLHTNIHFGSN